MVCDIFFRDIFGEIFYSFTSLGTILKFFFIVFIVVHVNMRGPDGEICLFCRTANNSEITAAVRCKE